MKASRFTVLLSSLALVVTGLLGVAQPASADSPLCSLYELTGCTPLTVTGLNDLTPSVINMANVPNADQAAVQAFENNAVAEVLTEHNLQPSDSEAVLGWARSDIRAQEWLDLSKIIGETPQQRQTNNGGNDELVFEWFQHVYQQQEITEAQDAIDVYEDWSGLPITDTTNQPAAFTNNATLLSDDGSQQGFCNFTPPGGSIAGPYDNGQGVECVNHACINYLGCVPQYPTLQQFQEWGDYEALNGEMNNPDFAGASLQTVAAISMGAALAVTGVTTALSASFGGAGIGAAAVETLYSTFAARALYQTVASIATYGASASADAAAQAASAAALTAGAVAFVVGVAIFAITTIVLESIQIAQDQAIPGQLQSALSAAQSDNNPDLASQLSTSSGESGLFALFVAQTMPDVSYDQSTCGSAKTDPCANAPAIPAASASADPTWDVSTWDPTTQTLTHLGEQHSIYTPDLLGPDFLNTRLSGNAWFVSQKNPNTDTASPGSPDPASATFQSLDFDYTDWSGNNWSATRITGPDGSPEFALTPLDSSNNGYCTQQAGITSDPTPGVQPCITNTLDIETANGTDEQVQILSAAAAGPQVAASVPATVYGSSAAVSATSADPNGPLTYTWTESCPLEGTYLTQPEVFPADPALNPQDNQPLSFSAGTVLQDECGLNLSNQKGFAIEPLTQTYTGQNVTLAFPRPGKYPVQLTVTDANGNASTTNYTVTDIGSTATTITPSSSAPTAYGQPVTFTATVAPGCSYCEVFTDPQFASPGLQPVETVHPVGDVQFYLNGKPVGDPVPLGQQSCDFLKGDCTLTLNPPMVAQSPQLTLPEGTNNVVEADYIGDVSGADAFAPSSGKTSFEVDAGSYTSTASAPASITYGQAATLTATVAPVAPSTVTPSGTVQFYVDGSAVGSSVPLNSSGQAAISDSDLTVIPNPGLSLTFGAHTVEAKFSPNDGYTTGSDVTTDVSVTPAPLTVTGSSPTVTYGAAAPTISPQYSGFVPGDSAASLTSAPACTTTYVQGDAVTSVGYPTTCTGGSDPNYSFTYDQGAVTVTQAPLTVKAADESMVYGGKVPTYGFSYSGFIGSDGPSSAATPPTCGAQDPATSGPVTASTHWGTYPITCGGGAAQNYSFSYVPGTLTVSEFASSLVYSGDQTVLGGSTFKAAAQVYSSAGACPSGQAVSFSLDRNPVTGTSGSYLLGGATSTGGSASVPVPTTGWKPGVYAITAASDPTVTCSGGSQSATLTVGTAGSSASASGTYSLAAQGKVTFSLTAATSSGKTTGQISVSTGQWEFTGTVSRYVITGSAGSATGSGQLSLWNQSLNKGKGGWQLVASGVSITASFTASVTGPTKVPGTFGVNIVYSPTSSQPALPSSAPQSIGGGDIKVS